MKGIKRIILLIGLFFSQLAYSQSVNELHSDSTGEPPRKYKMTMQFVEYNRGMSSPVISNIKIKDGNTDLLFLDVVLDDASFFPDYSIIPNNYIVGFANFDPTAFVKAMTEPYYGVHYQRFFERHPNFAIGVDFIHFKVFVKNFDQVVKVRGKYDGVQLVNPVRIGDYMKMFSISHGINHLGVSFTYRMMLLQREKIPDGILQPFVGFTFGPAIPHGELIFRNPDGSFTQKVYSYRLAFPNFGLDFTLGLRFKPHPNFGLNITYKYSYSLLGNVTFDDGSGGSLSLFFPANHLQWGITIMF